MKRTIYIIVFLLLGFFVVCSSCHREYDENLSSCEDNCLLQPRDSIIKYYGDLTIQLVPDVSGSYVLCLMYFSGILVGVQTLTATSNQYQFDLKLADYTACGKLVLSLGNAPQVSKVSGDFQYSVVNNHQSFQFKGDIIFWYYKYLSD